MLKYIKQKNRSRFVTQIVTRETADDATYMLRISVVVQRWRQAPKIGGTKYSHNDQEVSKSTISDGSRS